MQEQLRIVAFVVVLIGSILAAVSLFADPLGLGAAGSGFGWKQSVGTIVGLIFVAIGLLIWRYVDRGEEKPS